MHTSLWCCAAHDVTNIVIVTLILAYPAPQGSHICTSTHSPTARWTPQRRHNLAAFVPRLAGSSGSRVPVYDVSVYACRFRLGRQEDSHEYLRCLLDAMHEACLKQFKPKPPPELAQTTIVNRIFGGKLRSRVRSKRIYSSIPCVPDMPCVPARRLRSMPRGVCVPVERARPQNMRLVRHVAHVRCGLDALHIYSAYTQC